MNVHVAIHPVVSCTCMYYSCTANPVVVDDTPLTDTPPHILVYMNTLCQDDEHVITVLFGTRPIGMMMECAFQQLSVLTDKDMVPTTIEPGGWQIYVPENIVLDEGEEYCYRVLLGAFQGVIDVQEGIDGKPHFLMLFCCTVLQTCVPTICISKKEYDAFSFQRSRLLLLMVSMALRVSQWDQ